LAWRNLFFTWLNPWFGAIPAILYLVTAWIVMADIGRLGLSQFWTALVITLRAVSNSPAGVFWTLAIFGGFLLFTDTHSLAYRRIAGPLHGFAHLAAAFFVGWGASYLAVTILSLPFRSLRQLAVSALVILVGGYLVGSIIMGIYLLISLNVFGRHMNEAFSALHIPDWKSFLRLRIDANGRLTIFPVGVRRVPRKWITSSSNLGSRIVPDDPAASAPVLIEAPFVVTGPLRTRSRRRE